MRDYLAPEDDVLKVQAFCWVHYVEPFLIHLFKTA